MNGKSDSLTVDPNDVRWALDMVPTPAGGWRVADEKYHREWMERVKRRVVISETGCWLWQGILHPKGYGMTAYRSKTMNLHRAMWIVTHDGQKPSQNQLVCHKCDIRNCCNPDHLFLGTAKDNNRDCGNKGRHHNSVKTHCKRGHEFTFENTYLKVTATTVMRACLECQKLRSSSERYREMARERARRKREAKRSSQRSQYV